MTPAMPDLFFANCQVRECGNAAISFSSFCWLHTPQQAYLSKLKESTQKLGKTSLRLNFKKVTCEELDFSGMDLRGSSFSQAHFTNSHFIGSNLSGCDLIGARFQSCDFVGSDLCEVNLTKSVLVNCSFSHTDLRRANLAEAHLRDVDFMGASLCGAVLWNADLNSVKNLKKKNFQDLTGDSKNGKAYLSESNALTACESYRLLKHYLYRRGLYENASWAAYRELTMERKYFLETWNPRYFPSLLMDLFSGYTEKPSRVILSSLAIVVVFGLIYFFFNVPAPTQGPLPERVSLWDSFYFSFITFTTVGYGDFTPKPLVWFRALACLEAFSGPFMAGLYIFTLTRRYAAG